MFSKVDKNKEKATDIQTTKPAAGGEIRAFDEMDRMFDQFLSNSWLKQFPWRIPEMKNLSTYTGVRVPSVDVVENDKDIVLRAEIPGVDKENISISLSDNTITIQGKTHKEEKEDKGEYHRCEISSGSFSRTLTLPANVNSDKTKATFTNGVLEVTMPKSEAESRHTVKVQ